MSRSLSSKIKVRIFETFAVNLSIFDPFYLRFGMRASRNLARTSP